MTATERDLKALFTPADWSTLHLQMIYFGREHCPARGHDLAGCAICSWSASQGPGRPRAGTRGAGRPATRSPAERPQASRAHSDGRPKPRQRPMITGLDHVVIAVRDLDAAVRAYEALLGRAASWRAEADGGGAEVAASASRTSPWS